MTEWPGELIYVSKCSKNEENLDSTRRRKVSPLGMYQKVPSLPYQHIRHLSSSREPRPISAVAEKGEWAGEEEGREREADEGWAPWNLYKASSLLLCVASLHFSEFQTWFSVWEGLGFTDIPKENFCSSSIRQPYRNLGSHRHRSLRYSSALCALVSQEKEDSDTELCGCGLSSAHHGQQPQRSPCCQGSGVVAVHGALRLTQQKRLLTPNHCISELRGLQDPNFPNASFCRLEKRSLERGRNSLRTTQWVALWDWKLTSGCLLRWNSFPWKAPGCCPLPRIIKSWKLIVAHSRYSVDICWLKKWL